MIQITPKSECTGCHGCMIACPAMCITMEKGSEGFLYPKVNTEQCIDCGLCEQVCPIITPPVKTPYSGQQAYAAMNKDEGVRLDSSSGGVFTLLAKWIINQGGIVYGATFNDVFEVIHIGVESVQDLEMLRGSKYVQSRMGECYTQAKEQLDIGRFVLFTGTPCQIAGLKAYLRKDYDNLYCQDIICHGVPSPMVWGDYIKLRQDQLSEPVDKIGFRRKNKGWKKFSIAFDTQKESVFYQNTLDSDPFMRGFLSDFFLRPSCYACHFKTLNRDADITLADFWGIQKILPAMDDNKGTSLVLVNSDKGNELWQIITSMMRYESVDLDTAISFNGAAVTSATMSEKRKQFFDKYGKEPFNDIVERLTKVTFGKRVKRGIKRRIRNIIMKK